MKCYRTRAQLAEAFGPVNRWYCSQAHGRAVGEPETLLRHFIRNGGAQDFAARYADAMSPLNRWFCSEFYGREICEPEILWCYYMSCRLAGPGTNPTRPMPMDDRQSGDLSIAS